MKNRGKKILKVFLRYVIIAGIISAITSFICFLSGERHLDAYCAWLLAVAFVILIIGFLSLMGTQKSTASSNYQYIRSVGAGDSNSRLKQDFKLINGAYAFFIKSSAVAGLIFIITISIIII